MYVQQDFTYDPLEGGDFTAPSIPNPNWAILGLHLVMLFQPLHTETCRDKTLYTLKKEETLVKDGFTCRKLPKFMEINFLKMLSF